MNYLYHIKINIFLSIFCCLFLTIISTENVNAQSSTPVIVNKTGEIVPVTSGIEELEDSSHNMVADSAFNSKNFKLLSPGIPNKNISTASYWYRIKVRNETDCPMLLLKLSNPALDSIVFYEQVSGLTQSYHTGESVPFAHREYISSDYLFNIHIAPNTEKYIYLHISSCNAPLLLPLSAGTQSNLLLTDKHKDIFWGVYIGIMIAMLLYNFFIYITTKDNSYLYYMLYMLSVLVTQITVSGYAFQLLWPSYPTIEKYSLYFAPVLAGITTIEFIRHFLRTRTFLPNANKIFLVLTIAYLAGLLLGFAGIFSAGRAIIDITALVLSFYILAIAFVINKRGYRPALFILVAWIVFLAGVFIFIFKNFGILPYNNFTVYTMPVGSAMEALLLSFALADRINMLKKEIEQAQSKELRALQENERIVREQNILLEDKVNERTAALKLSNDGLNTALGELKNAQAQLVESEKMASLGQLTAGIAHEINNPINFITSNIQPLNRDVQVLVDAMAETERILQEKISMDEMYKRVLAHKTNVDLDYTTEEIGVLLKGIRDGATRTAEIVKGLRVFSRLDESDLKKADINEGLDATLAITSNLLTDLVKLEKTYTDQPQAEYFAGQVNQVLLIVISNAIQAIKDKFGDREGGVLSITTATDSNNIAITIKDNGIGMDEYTRSRIFEPFFTTRKVGVGSGLGLAIALNIINKHKGKIQVASEAGSGSECVITIPIVFSGK